MLELLICFFLGLLQAVNSGYTDVRINSDTAILNIYTVTQPSFAFQIIFFLPRKQLPAAKGPPG